ncbi:hypothetical protein DPX39_090009200 [Trypanosoma brucei equiperdum]|uniref:Ankyrin repeats (3 copies) n=1 Tax=Trypanosoma brucei equiperdum TaxID=630700 RepID=A0A3L6L0F1_9TRYP|nr:hypothetical protein DPX39_090009200 [Trypanosoma brucei equiperdum]
MGRTIVQLCQPQRCRSFVEETLQNNSASCFADVLHRWYERSLLIEAVATTGQGGVTPATATNQCAGRYHLYEVQLLNKKLSEAQLPGGYRALENYTVAHFAAELGSIPLLGMAEGGILLPRGVHVTNYALGPSCAFEQVPLDIITFTLPDGEGNYLSHIAAKKGHVEFIAALVRRFGAAAILGQHTHPDLEPLGQSLSVYETAFVYGSVPVLHWLDTSHPFSALGPAEENAVRCVQRAALYGHADSLRYFMQLHGLASHEVAVEALYPAAEAGFTAVLQLLVHTLGEKVVWRPDSHGATALHHAARLGCKELLLDFFQHYELHQHVDDKDNAGRTPAMWCVLGLRKRSVVEFLKLLLKFGSKWPTERDDEGNSMVPVVEHCYSPTSNIRAFVKCTVASSQR